MASDIYEYETKIGNLRVEVSYLDYPREHVNCAGVYGIGFFKKSDERIFISRETHSKARDIISKWITQDKIQLEYLGWHCSNGDCGGPRYDAPESDTECCPCCGRTLDG